MEVFPVVSAVEPAKDVVLRRGWATIARNSHLLLGCVVVALLAGAVIAGRMERVYRASASVRLEPRRGVPAGGADASLLATAAEVLGSRSLASEVADSLGLRLRVEEPRRARRGTVIAAARVDSAAPLRRYRLSAAPGGQVSVHDSSGGDLGTFAAAAPVVLPGVTLRLASGAPGGDDAVVRVTTPAEATSFVHERVAVRQPNANANVLDVDVESTDPALARDLANALVTRFVSNRVAAEKAGVRLTVALLRRQLDTLTREARARESATNAFLQRHALVNAGDVAAQRTAELTQLTELRIATAADRDLLAASLNALANGVPADDRVAVERLLSAPAFLRAQSAGGPAVTLAARLRTQEDQHAQLLTRLDRNDPDVRSVERQIEATKRDIRATAESFVASQSEQVRAYDQRIGAIRRASEGLPAQQLALARLQREQRNADELMNQVHGRLKEAEIAAAVPDSTAAVLDTAELPTLPLGSSVPRILALWLLAGIVAGAAAALLRERLDTTVHDEQDVLEIARVPVIGIIPFLRPQALASRGRPIIAAASPPAGLLVAGTATRGAVAQTVAAAAYRTLRTNLSYVSPANPPRVIVVTSALSGEGKTTSASNLAVTLAQQGKRVLLIDAETRRGNLHLLFGIEAAPGFFDLLYGQSPADECVRRVTVDGAQLDVLPSGGASNSNAADLLIAGMLAPFFAALRTQYDYVLIDTPPLNLFTDAALLGAQADATLLVARADRTERQALRFAMRQLQHVRAHVAGAILNGVDIGRNSRFTGGYDLGRYAEYTDD